jgi:hypothetical protein
MEALLGLALSYQFTTDPWIGAPHLLHSGLHLGLAFSHTLTQHSTS